MLQVDPTSSVPPFEQLREQITAQVESGELRAGDRLPTVRRLAEDLGLAANTVARAYRELEGDGLLEGRGRSGTFVADDDSGRAARVAARTYATTVRSLGLSQDEAVDLVRRALSA
ncbi:GntR family transcriptional regulator [Georgenia daeguensis]|uniref:GntR family transcriptional regulator n=1 Tax=Georgenia daeguensis TaxID=908355 RepID=A0ABP8ENS4_9MICO